MDDSRSKPATDIPTHSLEALLRLSRISSLPQISIESRNTVLSELESYLNPSPLHETPAASPPHSLDLQVRQLVRANAPWTKISTLLQESLKSRPCDDTASRLLELAFVQATPDEVIASIEYVLSFDLKDFYRALHPKIRDFALENMSSDAGSRLGWILQHNYRYLKPTQTEVVALFLKYLGAQDKTSAWIFFSSNKEFFTLTSSGLVYGLTRDQLIHKVGSLALSLGYNEDAKALFTQLSMHSLERDSALQELLHFETQTFDRGRHKYFVALEGLVTWTERLEAIDEYCRQARRKNEFSDYNRPALNSVFKDLTSWVPPTPEAWHALSELALRNRDLDHVVPNELGIFTGNIKKFHAPSLERALWQPVAAIAAKHPKEQALGAAARLHLFMADQDYNESDLWSAREMFLRIDGAVLRDIGCDWRDAVTAALSHAETSATFTEEQRSHKAACLRLALHAASSSDLVIEQYLELTRAPSGEFIENLARLAWQEQNVLAFLKVTTRYSQLTGLSPELLAKVWAAAVKIENHDLAWRVSTIAASRKVLSKDIQQCWEISGERRSAYTALALQTSDFEVALETLPLSHRKILNALCILGSRLSSLTSLSKNSLTTLRPFDKPNSPLEEAIHKALQATCLGFNGKAVASMTGSKDLPDDITTLVHDLDRSPWTFAVKTILERLSAPAWGYQVDILRSLTNNLGAHLGLSSSRFSQNQIGRWLAKLDGHERSAWSELSSALAEHQTLDFDKSLAKFAVRLAIMTYPAHYLALSSLQQAQASLLLINDLESFLLSPKYTVYRNQRQIHSRVKVPEPLREMILISV